jgi:flagellum-specific peptidoglycan hydrolase FlgJ
MLFCSTPIINSKQTVYKAPNIEVVETTIDTVIDNDIIKDSIKNEIIQEVAKYIKTKTSKSHEFIPKYLVHAGLSNNIDICFMMAQTQIETNYGTLGAGRESSRRSMFGVIKRNYPDYESAINHYCEVLKKYYLVKGRTEQHLMTKYVTSKGGKYAGDPNYEKSLKTAYNSIKRSTKIYSLQQEYYRL